MNKKCQVEKCNRIAKPGERFCSDCKRDYLARMKIEHSAPKVTRHTEERGRKQPRPLGDYRHGPNEDRYDAESKP